MMSFHRKGMTTFTSANVMLEKDQPHVLNIEDYVCGEKPHYKVVFTWWCSKYKGYNNK